MTAFSVMAAATSGALGEQIAFWIVAPLAILGGVMMLISRKAVHSALWIALPVIGMVMFANLALGIVSRVAPQMNIFSVGFPVTLGVGLVGVTATLPMLDQPFMSLMERVLEIF